MKIIGFTLVMFAVFSLVFSGFNSTIFAAESIDQQNTASSSSSLPIQTGTAQSFTPAFDNIVKIDISLKTLCSGDTWTVHIHENNIETGDIVYGPVPYVVDTSVLVQHVPISPLVLTPESLYVVELDGNGNCQWEVNFADTYSRGQAILGSPTGFDFIFTTFTDPTDTDGDGVSDIADLCEGHDDAIDIDRDNIPDGCDDFIDTDGDGVPNDLDLCEGHDDAIDIDGDNIPDGCDDLIDSDNDTVPDDIDQCPGVDDTVDENNDGIPDCVVPPKKSCEALEKENPGKAKGKERAKENNSCTS